MRRIAAALVLFGPACVMAQMPLPNFQKHWGELRQRGLLPEPANTNPTPMEPKSPAIVTGQEGELPQDPTSPQSSNEIRILKTGSVNRVGDIIKLGGSVHIQYRGYDLFANEIEGNVVSQVFTLIGSAKLITIDSVIEGEDITVDYLSRKYKVMNHRSELGPRLIQGITLSLIYASGEASDGSEDEIHLKHSDFTTCDKEHPHYSFHVADGVIRPEKRIIGRNVKLKLFGRTILNIPYLSIPLDTRRERNWPEVGRTPDQGYYVKTTWAIPINGNRSLDTYVDYFELLGLGLGGRFRYAGPKFTGFTRVYSLIGNTQSAEINIGHRQLFGAALASFETNYQQRNYLNAPQNTSWSTRASLTLPQGRNQTRFSYSRYSNESPTFGTVNQNIGVSDQRQFGIGLKTTLDVNYVSSKTTFAVSDPVQRTQVDVRFRGTQELRTIVAELEYQRSIPIGETANFFSSTDRTPVFTLRSDSGRLFGQDFQRRLPFQTEISVGEFANPGSSNHITRTFFDFQTSRSDPGSGRMGLSLQGRFRQSIYSDNTAQFATLINAAYRYSFSRDTGINFRYNFLRPRGFTPLSIDRLGSANLATIDVSFKVIRSLSIGSQSGYDFLEPSFAQGTHWQQVGVRSEWRPNDRFQLRGLSVYDPTIKKWSTTRLDAVYEVRDFYAGIGARYDGTRSSWSNVNLFVDGLKFGRLRSSFLLAYNGYTKKFDNRHFQFTYDMHCTEAVLQVIENNVGFRSGRQINFFIRIKAFPSDSGFGIGNRGQPIGTATGSGF